MKHLKQLILLLLIIFSLTGCHSSVSDNPISDIVPEDEITQDVQQSDESEKKNYPNLNFLKVQTLKFIILT